MSCKKLVIFSGLLLSFVFSSLLVSSSYATSVDCTINKDSPYTSTSLSYYTYTFSDICSNFSSLDSSKDWYFITNIDVLKYLDDDFAWYAYASDPSSSPIYSYQYPNFRIFSISRRYRPSSFPYSNFFITSTSNAKKPIYIGPSGNNYQLLQDYYIFNSFTITDEKPSFSSNTPTGNIDITSNGTYDVTQYASATVNVPQEISTTPYDEKLDQIIKAIYVCAGTMLVIYFFYCIYRMILKKGGL